MGVHQTGRGNGASPVESVIRFHRWIAGPDPGDRAVLHEDRSVGDLGTRVVDGYDDLARIDQQPRHAVRSPPRRRSDAMRTASRIFW
jgi:hypothetical protein